MGEEVFISSSIGKSTQEPRKVNSKWNSDLPRSLKEAGPHWIRLPQDYLLTHVVKIQYLKYKRKVKGHVNLDKAEKWKYFVFWNMESNIIQSEWSGICGTDWEV